MAGSMAQSSSGRCDVRVGESEESDLRFDMDRVAGTAVETVREAMQFELPRGNAVWVPIDPTGRQFGVPVTPEPRTPPGTLVRIIVGPVTEAELVRTELEDTGNRRDAIKYVIGSTWDTVLTYNEEGDVIDWGSSNWRIKVTVEEPRRLPDGTYSDPRTMMVQAWKVIRVAVFVRDFPGYQEPYHGDFNGIVKGPKQLPLR